MQLQAHKTMARPIDVCNALAAAWVKELGTVPTKPSICILLAQWALETAEGASMICWSIGNAKQPTDAHDYCEYATREYVPLAAAEAMVKDSSPEHPVTSDLQPDADGHVVVMLHPPHPGCRFRAYTSLEDGVWDYLTSMVNHWTKAWPGVLAGDPTAFAAGLKEQGYYTAPIAAYTRGVVHYFDKYMARLPFVAPELPQEEIDVPIDVLPDVTPDTAGTEDDPVVPDGLRASATQTEPAPADEFEPGAHPVVTPDPDATLDAPVVIEEAPAAGDPATHDGH